MTSNDTPSNAAGQLTEIEDIRPGQSVDNGQITDGVANISAQDPPGKSKKPKNHRGGCGEQVKKINRLFDHEKRRTCSECKDEPSAWACTGCDRTLPQGKWNDLKFGAEDKDDSIFGQIRQTARVNTFSAEDEAIAYTQIKELMKIWCNTEKLARSYGHSGSTTSEQTSSISSDWTWAQAKLSSEYRDDSIMGAVRRQLHIDGIESEDADDIFHLARSVAQSWEKVSQCFDSEGNLIKGIKQIKTMLDPEAKSKQLYAECPYEKVKDAARTEGRDRLDDPLLKRWDAEMQSENVSAKGDLAKMVQAQNERLRMEEEKKEQAEKARRAKKDEVKARKARAREEQRKGAARTAERRNLAREVARATRKKLTDAVPSLPSTSQGVDGLSTDPDLDSACDAKERDPPPSPIEEKTASPIVPPSLEGVAERMARKAAPLPGTDNEIENKTNHDEPARVPEPRSCNAKVEILSPTPRTVSPISIADRLEDMAAQKTETELVAAPSEGGIDGNLKAVNEASKVGDSVGLDVQCTPQGPTDTVNSSMDGDPLTAEKHSLPDMVKSLEPTMGSVSAHTITPDFEEESKATIINARARELLLSLENNGKPGSKTVEIPDETAVEQRARDAAKKIQELID